MQFSFAATLAVLFALASLSSARIIGFVGPSKPIKKGVPFKVTFKTENYITNNQQYYALFGLTTNKNVGNSLGSAPVANYDISKVSAHPGKNFTIPLTINEINSDATTQTLTTAVFGEVGASGGITLQYFNATVKVHPSS